MNQRPEINIETTEGVSVHTISLDDGSFYLAVDARHLHQGFGDFASVVLSQEQMRALTKFILGELK